MHAACGAHGRWHSRRLSWTAEHRGSNSSSSGCPKTTALRSRTSKSSSRAACHRSCLTISSRERVARGCRESYYKQPGNIEPRHGGCKQPERPAEAAPLRAPGPADLTSALAVTASLSTSTSFLRPVAGVPACSPKRCARAEADAREPAQEAPEPGDMHTSVCIRVYDSELPWQPPSRASSGPTELCRGAVSIARPSLLGISNESCRPLARVRVFWPRQQRT